MGQLRRPSSAPLGRYREGRVGRRCGGGVSVCRLGKRRSNRRRAVAARAVPGRGSGRRKRFWVEPFQGEEAVCERDERDVVVPAAEGAALEVVEPERVLELAVVLLDPPAQLGE